MQLGGDRDSRFPQPLRVPTTLILATVLLPSGVSDAAITFSVNLCFVLLAAPA
jgi:hypothetical protein